MRRSLDSPIVKSLSQVTLCHLPCRQFLRQAMEAGANLMAHRQEIACFVDTAPRLPSRAIFPGKAVIRTASPSHGLGVRVSFADKHLQQP